MEIWHIWIIVALVLVIVEIFTTGFAVVCLAVGCVGGAKLLQSSQTLCDPIDCCLPCSSVHGILQARILQ